MYDIEIIDGYRVAVITLDSPATKFIKAFYSAIMMKRLSSDTPETANFLSESELATAVRGKTNVNLSKDMSYLIRADLIYQGFGRKEVQYGTYYEATDAGLDLYKRLKAGEDEIEIPLE